jgi:ABC-type multidrug transport system fused ATPase/permease subunit
MRLSGGQRQRIAIARAVVGRPPILILDEATSSLDSESERLVQQAIDRAVQGATSVVIAHRLSTVLHADKIVVLGRGGVEAIGRHAELLASSATYGRLYRLQFAEAEIAERL